MDRLTMRDANGFVERVCQYGNDDCILCDCRTKCNHDIFNRLAAYEDTGLSPEEVRSMRTAYDENQVPYMIEAAGSEAVHLYNLLQAEAEGRLIVLPCKVGDTVYVIGTDFESGRLEGRIYKEPFNLSHIAKLGKWVFLTREEAEAAMKGDELNGTD